MIKDNSLGYLNLFININKFKYIVLVFILLIQPYLSAQSNQYMTYINYSQLVEIQNKNIDFAGVFLRNQTGWNVNYKPFTGTMNISQNRSVDCKKAGWIKRTYENGEERYDKIEFYQVAFGCQMVIYRTNIEQNYEALINEFLNNTDSKIQIQKSLFNGDVVRATTKGKFWESFSTFDEVDSEYEYSVVLYNNGFYSFILSEKAWDNVVENGYLETEMSNYVINFPGSSHVMMAKKRLEVIKNEKEWDSAWSVYQNISGSSDYRKIIETGEFLLKKNQNRAPELVSKLDEFKKKLAFVEESRYKQYLLDSMSPKLHLERKSLTESIFIENRLDYRNLNFHLNLMLTTDTFGVVKVLPIYNSSYKLPFLKNVNYHLETKLGGIILYNGVPIMTRDYQSIKYVSNVSEFQCKYHHGKFFLDTNKDLELKTAHTLVSVLESKNNDFYNGNYTFVLDAIRLNEDHVSFLTIEHYKPFAGIEAVIPSLLVPGYGTKLVRGHKGSAWISFLTYGLASTGTYFALKSQDNYEKYLSSINQQELDIFYNKYLANRRVSMYGFGFAAGIYSVNIMYVFGKGIQNSTRRYKDNKRYEKCVFEFD